MMTGTVNRCSWTVPSNIPVSAFGGNSLFGSLMVSVQVW